MLLLVELLRSHPTVRNGYPKHGDQSLDQAAKLAEQFEAALGARDHAPPVRSDALLNRHRAFTLLYNAYDKTRCGILYLRLEQGDGGRRAQTAGEADEEGCDRPRWKVNASCSKFLFHVPKLTPPNIRSGEGGDHTAP